MERSSKARDGYPSDGLGQRERRSLISLYQQWLEETHDLRFGDYEAMWRWSVTDLEAFWRSIWEFFSVESPTPYARALMHEAMPGAVWFDGARVNYARQVLRHVALAEAAGQVAIIAEDETGQSSQLTWSHLERQVKSLAVELGERGIGQGDRVVAYLPNRPETVIAFLACASIGAIWSVCAPDMGLPAVLDRFRQIEPKALIATDGIMYAGRKQDRSGVVRQLREALPSVQTLVLVRSGYAEKDLDAELDFTRATSRLDAETLAFEPLWLPFDHPLWIVYSSGTTGLPKAIVHSHGGIIMTALAGVLHTDIGPSYAEHSFGERFHWYSSTGWIMWNGQIAGLLGGTTICLFDGAPGGTRESPDWGRLWRFAGRHKVTWFGAGAAFYASCEKAGLRIGACGDLSTIQSLGSTGSPLPAAVQAWGTQEFELLGQQQVWWCNISGGTDICANFVTGNRDLPETPGRLQCRQLGTATEAWDEHARPVVGEIGELVCSRPTPSMPLYFWGDEDGHRYRESYFDFWPGVWRHGDWLRVDTDGACAITGRSDATINRHGLRMGTAELYAAVEHLPEIADTLVVDVEVSEGVSQLLMFVTPSEGYQFDEHLRSRLAEAIRSSLSPRFVPDRFIVAPGIPRTLSGKKQELPIKRLFQGRPLDKVLNADAMANPEILQWYAQQAANVASSQPFD